MKENNYKSNRARKEIIIPGLGAVLITNYENKRIAKLKDSSFLVSGIGDTEDDAINRLKQSYEKICSRFQDSD